MTVEIKAKTKVSQEDFSQALNTLEQINVPSGLLLNFGGQVLEFKHLFNSKYDPKKVADDVPPHLVGEPSNELYELRNYIPDWVIHKMQYDKIKKG